MTVEIIRLDCADKRTWATSSISTISFDPAIHELLKKEVKREVVAASNEMVEIEDVAHVLLSAQSNRIISTVIFGNRDFRDMVSYIAEDLSDIQPLLGENIRILKAEPTLQSFGAIVVQVRMAREVAKKVAKWWAKQQQKVDAEKTNQNKRAVDLQSTTKPKSILKKRDERGNIITDNELASAAKEKFAARLNRFKNL
jgi:hypothetical protein